MFTERKSCNLSAVTVEKLVQYKARDRHVWPSETLVVPYADGLKVDFTVVELCDSTWNWEYLEALF